MCPGRKRRFDVELPGNAEQEPCYLVVSCDSDPRLVAGAWFESARVTTTQRCRRRRKALCDRAVSAAGRSARQPERWTQLTTCSVAIRLHRLLERSVRTSVPAVPLRDSGVPVAGDDGEFYGAGIDARTVWEAFCALALESALEPSEH